VGVKDAPLRATYDADVVAKIRKAGGILLLVSNTPELCLWWQTFNKVTGITKNPYDTRRTAGGSSGGEVCTLFFSFCRIAHEFSSEIRRKILMLIMYR